MPESTHINLNDCDLSSSSKYHSIEDYKLMDVNKSMTLSTDLLNVCSFWRIFDHFQAQIPYCDFKPDVFLFFRDIIHP